MLKKFMCAMVCAILLFLSYGALPSKAWAAFVGPDNSPQYQSVKDVLDHPIDDSRVYLRGKIISKVAAEKYIFQDDSGEVTVKIDEKKLVGLDISPDTIVEINGQIEMRYYLFNKIEIEVNFIKVVS